MRLLLLDNFDSFTYNLLDYLRQLGCEVLVRRNDVSLTELQDLSFDGVVLSPGPGTPAAAGVMPAVIEAYHQQLPMLGVCLGHQALGEFFGAKISRANRPMHGKVSEVEWLAPSPLNAGLPLRMLVTRYHSLVLDQLPRRWRRWPVLLPPSRKSWRCVTVHCLCTGCSFIRKLS
nr:aminodeoxychorismate/anthranilate synthase component II [Hymenobacter sp. 5516J-16]